MLTSDSNEDTEILRELLSHFPLVFVLVHYVSDVVLCLELRHLDLLVCLALIPPLLVLDLSLHGLQNHLNGCERVGSSLWCPQFVLLVLTDKL